MVRVKKNSVIVEDTKKINELKSSEFGELKNDELYLSLIEALYLINKEKIDLNKSKKEFLDFASSKTNNFELKYLVYSDLRSRGLFLKGGGENSDFYLYDRGDRPTENSFSYLVFVRSEREPIEINKILEKTEKAMNIRKKAILALVDGEGDTTYYEIRKFDPRGKVDFNYRKNVSAKILDDRIITCDCGEELYLEYFFGKPFLENSYQLNFTEAYHLSKNNILDLELEKIISRGQELDSEFGLKKEVYMDLRGRGLVPKTGFKFGTHFRAYTEYNGPGDLSHAKYLVQAVESSTVLNPPELSRAVRLAQNVRKKILFALVDKDVSYLEIDRIKI